jgi:hypothetical protein
MWTGLMRFRIWTGGWTCQPSVEVLIPLNAGSLLISTATVSFSKTRPRFIYFTIYSPVVTLMYHRVYHRGNLHSSHKVHFCALTESHNIQPLCSIHCINRRFFFITEAEFVCCAVWNKYICSSGSLAPSRCFLRVAGFFVSSGNITS